MASREWATFAEYVSARSAALHRAAYLMVGDVGLAQDVVQEALIRTHGAWSRLHTAANAEAYTRKAITTIAIDWSRRKARSLEFLSGRPPEVTTPGHADRVDDQTWLWQCLLRLPVRQRVAIVLRYYEDLTEAQTAEAMGCAVGTVKSTVSAGMAKLRSLMGADRLSFEPDEVVTP
ncbi:MAG TPA: SigE family RNA polymerase sigma factor [Micromonosporaceae bacterium]|nr:SigE family RNA polymerase sigma factor [Micromonosporaceae bacterium]